MPKKQSSRQLYSTWKEEIQAYKRAHVNPPYDVSQFHGSKIITSKEIKRRECMFNPVTQKYTNSKQETQVRVKELSDRDRRYETAINKKVQSAQHWKNPYNTITQELLPRCKEPLQKNFKKVPDTRTNYNLINHSDHKKGRYINMGPQKPSGKAVAHLHRTAGEFDYNIVSNKYHSEHDAKSKKVHNEAKSKAEKKFWATHNFDPISVSYFDKGKEKKFQEMRSMLEKGYGMDQTEFLPESTKLSEGRLYNIVNQKVKHAVRLREKEMKDNRRVQSKARATEFEVLQKQRQKEEYDLTQTRSFNRVSLKREAHRHRGYDALTNQPFCGVGSKPLAPARKPPARHMWERADDIFRSTQSSFAEPSPSVLAAAAAAAKGRKAPPSSSGSQNQASTHRSQRSIRSQNRRNGRQCSSSSALSTSGTRVVAAAAMPIFDKTRSPSLTVPKLPLREISSAPVAVRTSGF